MNALKCENLIKEFGTGRLKNRVLDDLSLCVESGQLTLLMGPSGCGKSTLLALLSGLSTPTAGRVVALGKEISAMSDAERERFRLQHCGFVFQGCHLFGALNALHQVAYPLRFSGVDNREALARAEQRLAQVGLERHAEKHPDKLSGGEKQRVAIARALAKNPALVFADEPTSALDGGNGRKVVELLLHEAEENGAAVFCVTHDPRLVEWGDRIVDIEDGRITGDRRVLPEKRG